MKQLVELECVDRSKVNINPAHVVSIKSISSKDADGKELPCCRVYMDQSGGQSFEVVGARKDIAQEISNALD